jgi:GxxExxY protein
MDSNQITSTIIKCATHVHKLLGNTLQDAVYQQCLAIELTKEGFSFHKEKSQTVFYDGMNVEATGADFIVEKSVIVELKTVSALKEMHIAMAKNYITLYKFECALLLNFGASDLEYKKIVNPEFQISTS